MKNFITGIILPFLFVSLYSQVGVGTDNPESMTMLHVASPNKDKGVLIPRLTEEQRDANLSLTKDQNGLLIFNVTEDCFNYWNKDENQWNSLCGKLGKAVFTIDCSQLSVNGSYLNKTSLTSDNNLLLTVNVTKAGSYSIKATSSPDNKYYFTKSGEFLSTGIYTIEIPGYGTPENYTTGNGDLFTVNLNGVTGDTPCTFNVKVQDSSIKPEYRMDCSLVSVKGVYQKDKALDTSNFIEVVIRFSASLNGAPLNIYTDRVDGIKFDSGPIVLDNGGVSTGMVTQKVKLYGEGSPANYDNKVMTIFSNSTSSSATCKATVLVSYPQMSLYAIHGPDGRYDFSNAGYVPYKFINSKSNFGLLEESIVKFQGWSSISGANNPSSTVLTTVLLGANPPDIVVTGYYFHPNAASAAVIKQYLDRGGVLIAYQEETTYTQILLQGILGSTVTSTTANGAGAVYQFPMIEDPVLTGPFGDIRGAYWGEDASATQAVSNLSGSDVVSYTTTTSGALTAFRHKNMNFIFVGDGGFNSSGTTSNTASATAYPFWVDRSTFAPVVNPSYSQPVVNSFFTGNVFAWALERATNNGINPH